MKQDNLSDRPAVIMEKTIIDHIERVMADNRKLTLALQKLLSICKNTHMQNESPVWMQQMGYAQEILNETNHTSKT